MIKYLLWDIDATLLNFKKAEYFAMREGFREFNLAIDESEIKNYNLINDKYWKILEKGEITRETVLHGRFREFFDGLNIGYNDKLIYDFNKFYQVELGNNIFFNDNAKETLKALEKSYKQYAITNGSIVAQKGKLKKSGLDKIFDGVFISEEMGIDKPNKEFFDIVFENVGSTDTREYLLVGDSLTSDILGANNAGIKNIWYNPENVDNKANVKVDYTINNLKEVIEILENI